MAKPKIIDVQESMEELMSLLHQAGKHHKRIQMLMLIKGGNIVTKRALAKELGISDRTPCEWRNKYVKGGLQFLLQDDRRGRSKQITPEAHVALEKCIKDKAYPSCVDIYDWLKKKFGLTIGYQAVHLYIKRNFGGWRGL